MCSEHVGIPVSLLMIQENATVTVCHSRTKDIHEIVKRADVVIAAIGQPQFVCFHCILCLSQFLVSVLVLNSVYFWFWLWF
jgi:5,10-methylene-tetrahydrofolate dehydrogenase/methenyl tetrahydrofolate cyclohydrolase